MSSSDVQIGPVAVPIVGLAGVGAVLALLAVAHGASRPVREVPRGRAQERALDHIDRRLEKLSRAREKARARIDVARERAATKKERAFTAARNARLASGEKLHQQRGHAIETKERRIDAIAERIERSTVTPSEIRELMKSGALRLTA